MSKTIIIKRAREARTFNRKGRYSRAAAISSLAKNERNFSTVMLHSQLFVYNNRKKVNRKKTKKHFEYLLK